MKKYRIPKIEKILERKIPIKNRISIRNLTRHRIRTTSTIIGVSLSIMLILSTMGMMDSFQEAISQQYEEHELWDMKVYLKGMENQTIINMISKWSEVKHIEPAIIQTTKVKVKNQEKYCLLIAYKENTSMHKFNIIEGEKPREDAIITSADLAKTLALSLGDEIKIEVLNKTLRVIGINSEPMTASTIYLTLKTAQKMLNMQNRANIILIKTNKPDEIRRRLYNLTQVERVDLKTETYNEWSSIMEKFTIFNQVMLIMGSLIALAITLNTITINILERKWETITLKTIGTPNKTIAKMIITENFILTIPAITIGLILGYITAYYFIKIFTTQLTEQPLQLELYIKITTYLQTIAAITIATIISQAPAIRHIFQMKIAEAIKEIM